MIRRCLKCECCGDGYVHQITGFGRSAFNKLVRN